MSDWLDELEKVVEEKVTGNGALGYYLMVIKAEGKTVSFKGSHKAIDGFHFYAHLMGTLEDDVKEDLAPYLKVKLVDDKGKVFG